MIFDIFASIVERHFDQELRPLLEKARLFIFPGVAKDVLPRSIAPEILEYLRDNFILPFPVVAFEDPSSCVIVYDLDKDQKGLTSYRGFVECLPMTADSSTFREHGAFAGYDQMMEEMKNTVPPDAAIITSGSLAVMDATTTTLLTHGDVRWQALCTKRDILITPEDLHPYLEQEDFLRPALTNATTALEEVWYANTPSRFILEEAPLNGGNGKKKIPRSHQRSQFTLLTPKEIRQRLRLPEAPANRRSPAPHERRRHYRTLRAERFKEMKGRTIVIPATWVGPSEVVSGSRVYRVRLDL